MFSWSDDLVFGKISKTIVSIRGLYLSLTEVVDNIFKYLSNETRRPMRGKRTPDAYNSLPFFFSENIVQMYPSDSLWCEAQFLQILVVASEFALWANYWCSLWHNFHNLNVSKISHSLHGYAKAVPRHILNGQPDHCPYTGQKGTVLFR